MFLRPLFEPLRKLALQLADRLAKGGFKIGESAGGIVFCERLLLAEDLEVAHVLLAVLGREEPVNAPCVSIGFTRENIAAKGFVVSHDIIPIDGSSTRRRL